MRKTKQQKETEDALLKRALGFTQEEIYSEDIIDKESGEVTNLAKRKIIRKTVPPTSALCSSGSKTATPTAGKTKFPLTPKTLITTSMKTK